MGSAVGICSARLPEFRVSRVGGRLRDHEEASAAGRPCGNRLRRLPTGHGQQGRAGPVVGGDLGAGPALMRSRASLRVRQGA